MIFDDHDVLDDWNTSALVAREMQATSWWRERISGALSVLLGLPAPRQPLARRRSTPDELYAAVRADADGEAVAAGVRPGAPTARPTAPGARCGRTGATSGGVRLLVDRFPLRPRSSPSGRRSMVGEREFAWIEDRSRTVPTTISSSGRRPWLLPRALHDVESANEALCDGGRGPARGAASASTSGGPWTSSTGRRSTIRSSGSPGSIGRIGSGEDGDDRAGDDLRAVRATSTTPTSARRPTGTRIESRVYQLTCSPMHNGIPLAMRAVFKVAWNRFASRLTRFLVRFARATPATIDWTTTGGPFFGNHVASLRYDGRTAEFGLQKSEYEGEVTLAKRVPEAYRNLTDGRRPKGLATGTPR